MIEEKTFKPCARGQHDQCAEVDVFDPESKCICTCHGMGVDPMTQEQFDRMLKYSCTLPTGTTIGKKWKRDINEPRRFHGDFGVKAEWWSGEYVPDPDPELVGIVWRRIVIRS